MNVWLIVRSYNRQTHTHTTMAYYHFHRVYFLLLTKLNFPLTEFPGKSFSCRSLYSIYATADGGMNVYEHWMGSIKTGIQPKSRLETHTLTHTHTVENGPVVSPYSYTWRIAHSYTATQWWCLHSSTLSKLHILRWLLFKLVYSSETTWFDFGNSEKWQITSCNRIAGQHMSSNHEWVRVMHVSECTMHECVDVSANSASTISQKFTSRKYGGEKKI